MNSSLEALDRNDAHAIVKSEQRVDGYEIDDEAIIEALGDLVCIYCLYTRLSSAADSEDFERVRRLIDAWIELLGPVKYTPGLVEDLSNSINSKLWNSRVDCDVLGDLLVSTFLLKSADPLEVRGERGVVDSYRELVIELLEGLGYSSNSELVNRVLNSDDPEDLISLAVLSLVLATNLES